MKAYVSEVRERGGQWQRGVAALADGDWESVEEYAEHVARTNPLVVGYALDPDCAAMGDEDGEEMAARLREVAGVVLGGYHELVVYWFGPGQMTVESVELIDDSPHADILAVLRSHGEVYTGGPSREQDIAREWADYGFDDDATEEWCSVGVWDAAVAAALRAGGVTPSVAQARAEKLVEAIRDYGGEPAEVYTDGCPIYSICNGDTSIDVLLTLDGEERS